MSQVFSRVAYVDEKLLWLLALLLAIFLGCLFGNDVLVAAKSGELGWRWFIDAFPRVFYGVVLVLYLSYQLFATLWQRIHISADGLELEGFLVSKPLSQFRWGEIIKLDGVTGRSGIPSLCFVLPQGELILPLRSGRTGRQRWRQTEPADGVLSLEQAIGTYCHLPLPTEFPRLRRSTAPDLGPRVTQAVLLSVVLLLFTIVMGDHAGGMPLYGVNWAPLLGATGGAMALASLFYMRKVALAGRIIASALLTATAVGFCFFASSEASVLFAPLQPVDFELIHVENGSQTWITMDMSPRLEFDRQASGLAPGSWRRFLVHHGPFNIYSVGPEVLLPLAGESVGKATK